MTTLWITGAGGVVGTQLVEQAAASGHYDQIHALTHRPNQAATAVVHWSTAAIDDGAALAELARRAPPDVIINPAAMTNVDACEAQRTAALAANATGPRCLAKVAREHAAHLIHVSTDYVFPGDDTNPGPYREDAVPRPVNYYGETKYLGEQAIQAICGTSTPYTIVRTALVYGLIPGGRINFVTWLARELRAGRRVKIVTDQFNTPTLADDLAALLLWQAEQQITGLYHGAGPDHVGRHTWAEAIVAYFDLDAALIDWTTTAELGQTAIRPLRSGLICPRWEADLARGAPARRGIQAGLVALPW